MKTPRNPMTVFLACSGLALAVSCYEEDEPGRDDRPYTPRAEPPAVPPPVTTETWENLKSLGYERRMDFERDLEARFDALERDIDQLRPADAPADVDLDDEAAELREELAQLRQKLVDLKAAAADQWNQARDDLVDAARSLQESLREKREALIR